MSGKILGVLGGLGPMASAYFYELITAHTYADCDQDHIDIVISSKATTPDRTAYILGQSTKNPFKVMQSEAQRLITFGAEVIAIPCNTAHYFYECLNEVASVPVLNMVNLTAVKAKYLGCSKLGILATDGTIFTTTYQTECEKIGLDCAVPTPEKQELLMQVIYEDIKAGHSADIRKFNSVAEELFAAGCDNIVLGCTELSLIKKTGILDGRFIDSMDVLAEAAILACGKNPVNFSFSGV